jgi:hypothetical protein
MLWSYSHHSVLYPVLLLYDSIFSIQIQYRVLYYVVATIMLGSWSLFLMPFWLQGLDDTRYAH